MTEDYILTIGPARDGRKLAVITSGGHPQIPGSGTCTVHTVALVDNLPGQDAQAWFARMVEQRPWETRQ